MGPVIPITDTTVPIRALEGPEISPASTTTTTTTTTPVDTTASFESVLMHTVEQANQADRTAAAQSEALAAGTIDDLHGTMISLKEAEISMKLVGSIRNKLLDAFHEIWRTSV